MYQVIASGFTPRGCNACKAFLNVRMGLFASFVFGYFATKRQITFVWYTGKNIYTQKTLFSLCFDA